MKEITRISLASLPYNIEIGAKKELEIYIRAIEKSLGADADAMKEIEARIAELFADRGVTGEKVISLADVDAVKKQLGSPKDFADESTAQEADEVHVAVNSERKLMRDTNDQVLGGVCSGLAAHARVDTVWVRLGFVILAIVTGGAMIPIYLIMWIIIPPAKTAAERLQMQGKPVTLEAIQKESTVVAKQHERDQTVLTILRITAGIGMLFIATCAIMGIVALSYHLTTDSSARLTSWSEQPYLASMIAAGGVFIAFCIVIARALFRNNYAKRFWITLGILTALGLGLFATGVAGFGAMQYTLQSDYEKSQTTTRLDATAVANSKSLTVDGTNTVVNYIVTNETPRVELRYLAKATPAKPQVRIEKNGDSLTIGAFATKPMMCMGFCQAMVTVDVYGPVLDKVTASTGSISYESAGQKSLIVTAGNETDVALKGEKAIEELTLKAEHASVRTSEANVANVSLTADSQSTVSLGNIGKLTLTAPTTCSQGSRFNLDVAAVQSVVLNGTSWSGHTEQTPCMNLTVGTDEL